jgi:hypothetical protein
MTVRFYGSEHLEFSTIIPGFEDRQDHIVVADYRLQPGKYSQSLKRRVSSTNTLLRPVDHYRNVHKFCSQDLHVSLYDKL